MKQPIFVNEDAEYCKYLMKFFKGESGEPSGPAQTVTQKQKEKA
jgi:hypothetical protein